MVETPHISHIAASGSGGGNNPSGASSQTTVLKIPSGLENLQPGRVVEAVVVGKDMHQNTQLHVKQGTQLDELTVSSKLHLPKQSSLLIKILENAVGKDGHAHFRAQILSVDGKEPNLPKTTNGETIKYSDILRAVLPSGGGTGKPSPIIPNPSEEVTVVNVSKGAVLGAVVVKPSPQSSQYLPQSSLANAAVKAYGGEATSLKEFDQVQLKVISYKTDGEVGFKPSNATTSNTTKDVSYSAYQKAGAEGTYTKPSGEGISTKEAVSAFANRNAGTQAQNSSLMEQSGKVFTAKVIGIEKSGEAVLSSPLGTLTLSSAVKLAPGSTLNLEVISHMLKSEMAEGAQTDQKFITNNYKQAFSGENSPLHGLFKQLQSIQGRDGGIIRDIFPSNNNQAAAKLLWFLFNIQGGSAAGWIGKDNTQILAKSDQKDILKKLENTFSNMRKLYNETNQAGWHTAIFPFYDGEDLQFGRFYSRQDESDKTKGNDVRFLVELELDNLGEFQLDGFIKEKPSKDNIYGKQFDLYVRYKNEIDGGMEKEIRELFEASLGASGLRGQIIFERVKNFPIHPDEEVELSEDSGEIIV